jgi:4-alpha-glucanotransferase
MTTIRRWAGSTSALQHEKDFARRYLGVDGHDFAWDLIRAVWKSVAVFAITPMQDVLSLGGEARMNFPSKLGGNWEWRMMAARQRPSSVQNLGFRHVQPPGNFLRRAE